MLVDPLTSDQWVLQPVTAALVHTLWLECQWGLVGVMECGAQQQLQCVRVRNGWMCNVHIECVPVPIVICSDLPSPTNGDIDYGGGSTNSRPVDTVVTYTYNTGYTLNGGSTRTCGSNGVWSGSDPTCQRKCYWVSTILLLNVPIPVQRYPALIYPHWWFPTMVDPLTSDQWILELPTAVVMATLSLEGMPPGSVWMEGAGVGQLQLVKVRCAHFPPLEFIDSTHAGPTEPPPTTCPDLTVPTNGVIIYSPTTIPRLEGTVATQICLNEYVPSTTSTNRVCLSNRSWSGSALTCQCEYTIY